MSRQLCAYFLPSDFQPSQLRHGIAVVVDILRATTTMTAALASGAASFFPCATVDDALNIQKGFGAERCLLGGERGGVRIDGFDLSNSPADYQRKVVQNCSIAFTTTNGTRALLRASQAATVYAGSFLNLSAVTSAILLHSGDIHVVCAGTDGHVTGEDVLFAGALVDRLLTTHASLFAASDAARIAQNYWLQEVPDERALEAALRRSRGGQNLMRLGYESDIALAAATDTVGVLGVVSPDGAIRGLPASLDVP